MAGEEKELNPCSEHFQLHDHLIKQSHELIGDLYKKYNALASLPEKVDMQIELLEEIKNRLSQLPEHQSQLAVLARVVKQFDDHLAGDIKFREEIVKPLATQVNTINTQWMMVKYIIPIVTTFTGGVIGAIIVLVINHISKGP